MLTTTRLATAVIAGLRGWERRGWGRRFREILRDEYFVTKLFFN
jgi:hypothetical protein